MRNLSNFIKDDILSENRKKIKKNEYEIKYQISVMKSRSATPIFKSLKT